MDIGRGGTKGEPRVILDPDQSAALREKLLTELGEHHIGRSRRDLGA